MIPVAGFGRASLAAAESAGFITVDVILNVAPPREARLSYRTLPGSATAGADYAAAAGTLVFPAGQRQQSFRINLLGDTLDEAPETLRIELYGPDKLTIGTPNPITLTIADSSAPPALRMARAAATIGEAGGSVSVAVELSAASGVDVSVPYTLGGTASADDHRLSAGTLIIPAGSTGALLRVPVVDDLVDEDDETLVVALGTPANATLAAPASHTLTIVDDDTAKVIVAPLSLGLREEGPAGSYTLRLGSQPTATVTISLAPTATGGGQYTVAPAVLTFTPANWAAAQTVAVRPTDDQIDQGAAFGGRIAHRAASADPKYNGLAPIDAVTLTVDDSQDVAGVIVSAPALSVTEGGATASYALRLRSQPTQNVRVTVSGDAQARVGLGAAPPAASLTLTFTPANWSLGQAVRVTAVDDPVDEASPHGAAIGHTAASADPRYAGIPVAGVAVQVLDNDVAGVTVAPLSVGPIAEDGGSATYTVVLRSRPTADVTIDLATGPLAAVAPDPLVFTPAGWNVPQTVTLTAIDDAVDRGASYPVAVSHAVASADPFYAALPAPSPLTATVLDDDEALLAIEPAAAPAVEGGAATSYRVRLLTRPLGDVTVALAPDAQIASALPAPLVFTPANYDQWQAVTATAADDADLEPSLHGGTVTHTATSAAPGDGYNGVARTYSVPIRDNEPREILVSTLPATQPIAEANGTIVYTLTLNSQPSDDVAVQVDGVRAAGDDLLAPSPATITFTPANWDTPQTVTLTAVDDNVDRGDTYLATARHTVTSADPLYAGLAAPDVTVGVADDDEARVSISPLSVSVAEGGATATYQVALATRPLSDVTVAVNPGAQLTANPAVLTFTPSTWGVTQTVTLSAVDDPLIEGLHTGAATHTATSADPAYNGLAPIDAVTATIVDNDNAAIIVSPAGITVTEGGAAAAYTVRLASKPAQPVLITLAQINDPATPNPPALLFPPTLTIAPAAWNLPQTVTVSVADDAVADGQRPAQIGHTATSADANYNNLAGPAVAVTAQDDDVPGLLPSPALVSLTEGGAGATYALRLTSQPTGDVTVTLSQSGEPLLIAPATLTFTPATWNVPQAVTVNVPDDFVAEPLKAATISHSAASADPNYVIAPGPAVTVRVTDNDTRGVLLTPATADLIEGDAGDPYTVRLRSQPLAPVTVTLNPGAQLEVSQTTLTFTPANWNVAQNVVVTAKLDALAEGAHVGAVTHTTASPGDPPYGGLSATLSATIRDQVEVRVDDAAAAEGNGGPAALSFTISLSRDPIQAITVSYATADGAAVAGSDYLAAAGTIIFNPGGPLTQQVQIALAGDALYEPDEQLFLRLSGVAVAGGIERARVADGQGAGTIRNDDAPTLAFGQADYQVGEGAGSLLVRVRLDGPSAAPVSVKYATADAGPEKGTATAGADYLSAAGVLTFAAGEVEQSFSLPLVADGAAEPIYETVRLLLSEPAGATLSRAVATVSIIDDDAEPPAALTSYFQTGGPAYTTNGWNAFAPAGGYTYLRLDVPCGVTAPDLRFVLESPAIMATGEDMQRGGADTTRFELYRMPAGWSYASGLPGPGAASAVANRVYAPGAATPDTLYTTALPAGCGVYLLRAETATDDTNGWGVRVGYGAALSADLDGAPGSGDEVLVGVQQATARFTGPACETLYEYVRPGVASVTFRNFDLDGEGRVSYYPPSAPYDPQGLSVNPADPATGLAGSVSANGAWAADTFPNALYTSVEPGWWRIVTCNTRAAENHFVQEGQADAASYFVQPPAPALTLAMTSAAASVAPGGSVDVTVSFTNGGSGAARAALTVSLPPELSYESCSLPCALGADGTATVDLGLIPAGASGSLTLRLRASDEAAGAAVVRLDGAYQDLAGNPYAARAWGEVRVQ